MDQRKYVCKVRTNDKANGQKLGISLNGILKVLLLFWNFSVNLKLYEIKGNIYICKCNSWGSY